MSARIELADASVIVATDGPPTQLTATAFDSDDKPIAARLTVVVDDPSLVEADGLELRAIAGLVKRPCTSRQTASALAKSQSSLPDCFRKSDS